MRVLIACEFSGVVRDAFRARGHDAMSADLLPTERPGPHYIGDVRELIYRATPYDLVIAHPPCTYLSNSGVRWLYRQGTRDKVLERWELMRDAARFFRFMFDFNAPRIAVENPVMHGHASIRRPDFTVQPWQFGDPFKKRTCFWTKGLTPLRPDDGATDDNADPAVWRAAPSADRWKKRSVTYPGLARAMAEQWGARNA